jgi:hypothetical protein
VPGKRSGKSKAEQDKERATKPKDKPGHGKFSDVPGTVRKDDRNRKTVVESCNCGCGWSRTKVL